MELKLHVFYDSKMDVFGFSIQLHDNLITKYKQCDYLRWYGTSPYYGVYPIGINNTIIKSIIIFKKNSFPKINFLIYPAA